MTRQLTTCPHCGRPIALEALEEPAGKPSPTWPAGLETKPANNPDMRRYGYSQHDERIGMTGEEDSGQK